MTKKSRDEEDVGVAVLSWGHLVRMLRRSRARQRYWGLFGQLLQEYPASLRDRLRVAWPNI